VDSSTGPGMLMSVVDGFELQFVSKENESRHELGY
jgi:hypothetical protein